MPADNNESFSSDKDDPKAAFQPLTFQTAAEKNEHILEKVLKIGPYQYLLLPLIWVCQITAVSNEVYMVFGGAAPFTNCSVGNGTVLVNSTANEFKVCNGSTQFYGFIPEWNLTGRWNYIPTLMTSMQLAGSLVGSLVGGMLGDICGRWIILVVSIGGVGIFGMASAFSSSWPAMMAFRVIIGIFNGAYMSVAIVYMMESVNRDSRLLIEASLDCVNSLGFCWLALVAWLIQHWKWLSFITNVEVVPALLVLLFLYKESPRWLVQKGKLDQANKVIKYIAKRNGIKDVGMLQSIDEKELSLNLETDSSYSNQSTTAKQSEVKELLSDWLTVRYIILVIFIFFVTGTVGYGFIFNTNNLIGNLYLNFAILSIANMVAALVICFTEALIGLRRKVVHQVCLHGVWLWLVVVIVLYVLEKETDYPLLLDAASVIGSMFSVPLWTVSNLYSAEIIPTAIRNGVNGAGNMAAKLGGIIAPQFVGFVIKFWSPAPYIVFAVLALANAVVSLIWLPETKGKALPETKHDVHKIKNS